MDDITGVGTAKTAGIMGMLLPYAGMQQNAESMYIDEIEKSDMTPEAKELAIMNIRKNLKKSQNRKTIADIAIENAAKGTDFSEASGVSEEWLDRFMESAGFVSSEELQIVWGKILAKEFEKPGSTPKDMISVLAGITSDMIKAFRCLCSMQVQIIPLNKDGNNGKVLTTVFVPYLSNEEKFQGLGLSVDILNELLTSGVIGFAPYGGYMSLEMPCTRVLFCIGDKFEVAAKHPNEMVPVGNVMLTPVGEVLQRITDPIDIDGYYEMVKGYLIAGKAELV